ASSRSEVIDFRISVSMFEISDVNVPCRASFRSAQQNLTLGTERGCKRVGTRAEIEVEMSNDTKEPAGVSKDICYRHPVGWRFLQITNVEQACEMMFQSLSRSRLQGSLPNSISPQDNTPDLWFPNTKERNRHWCFFKRTRSLAESYGHA
ncbi:MAG: hypothetical protein WAO16_32480, partial [Pseudolabrys sp.]